MFQGSFSYDYKGLFHIQNKEIAKQKKAAQKEIDDYNASYKMDARIEQELQTAIRRLNIRKRPGGRKPVWKFIKKNGAMTRSGKAGGIDAICY